MIGRVYKIEVNKDDFYIGSTISTLKERERLHNIRLRENVRNNKLYEKCRDNNITKIICILLEEREVENIDEIRQLEQEYIEKLNPTLNSQSAYTGLTNKEYHKEYNKEYNKNNKEYIKKYNKEYKKNNKDKISERQTEKIKCPICNKIVSRCNILIHKKTMKCRKSVECFIQDD